MPTTGSATYAAVHEAEESHLALLGTAASTTIAGDGTLGKALRAALAGMADRLGRLLRDEKARRWAARRAQGARGGRAGKAGRSARRTTSPSWRSDVLLLDDLIGRQRLEDLAAVGRELTDAHKRLQDLLDRYTATKDEALRRQLEREVRELRARIADLAQKIATLKSRNDVPDEWRNLPDTKDAGGAGQEAGRPAARRAIEADVTRAGASWATICATCARCWIRTPRASARSASRRRTASSPI